MITTFSLDGRTALVTGAARGNGAAIAEGMARAGAKVIATDIDVKGAEETAARIRQAGGQAWGFGLDVSDASACQALAGKVAEAIGSVDVLVNNAGILIRVGIGQPNTLDAWKKTFAVNVDGPINMVTAFLDVLRKTRGCIINVGSIQSFVASPTSTPYAPSKGAVAQLTKTLAVELAADGIRVNAVAPGMFITAMSEVSRSDSQRLESFLSHVPLRRAADPDELVGPVVFLASSAASYVTGTILPVDGGYLAV